MANPAVEPFMAADAWAHPNTRRRMSTSRNPTTESTRWRPADGSGVDPDSCRICRGEATPDEPLFYPCKCSGSIKYVHQDCLMEWLSHSQKKHCELCKTPFRFTKLYSPKMPNTIPVHVFAAHMAKYLLRNVVVWLRAALVATVWLCWLPWMMRSVWSFLFWVSDDGLVGGSLWGAGGPASTSAVTDHNKLSVSITYDGDTCPASPLFSPSTNPASARQGLEELMRNYSSAPYVASWHGVNISTEDSISAALLRATLGSLASAPTPATDGTCAAGSDPTSQAPSTLLGNVSFLKNLSRFPLVNSSVIKILEGQIITILVIVCFILVILVRDYVVQQQPDINMRAAFGPNEEQPPRPRRQNEEERRMAQQVENLPGPDDDLIEPQPADSARADTGAHNDEEEQQPAASSRTNERPHSPTLGGLATPSGASNSSATGPVTEDDVLRADGGEGPKVSGAALREYLRIYRQSEGDPDKILQAIENEDLEESLGYWAQITRSMAEQNKEGRSQPSETRDESGSSSNGPSSTTPPPPMAPLPPPKAAHLATPSASGSDYSRATLSPDGGADSDKNVFGSSNFEFRFEDSDTKGKGKEAVDAGESEASAAELNDNTQSNGYNPLRPRAFSDGPNRTYSANPLANNNWSFSAISAKQPQNAVPQTDAGEGASDGTENAGAGSPGEEQDPVFGTGNIESNQVDGGLPSWPVQPPTGVTLPDEIVPDTNPENVGDEGHAAADRGIAQRPPLERGMMDRIADFMWADLEAEEAGALGLRDALPAQDADSEDGDEEDDSDFEDIPDDEAGNPEMDERDPEVVEAAVAAGLDPEAVDDAEDIEGVLELLGMRGPIVGLFQNAVFCAVLVSVTVFTCVFLPYNIGRLSVWGTMNPVRLLNILFSFTKFIQDVAVALVAATCSGFLAIMYYVGKALGLWLPSARRSCEDLMVHSWALSSNATVRVAQGLSGEFSLPSTVDIQLFSAVSHEALTSLKACIVSFFVGLGNAMAMVFDRDAPARYIEFVTWVSGRTPLAVQALRELPSKLLNPASWIISFGGPEVPVKLRLGAAVWSGMDRFWAIVCGYLSLCGVGALYLRRGTPFSSGPVAQEWEASLIDLLNQASGVMKVILIISIEMLVFPLYCGLLLDVALLPLFEDATLKSRLAFTVNYPLTSMFVHWFVGTGYMFHFALFVSMCRKIMRNGVLYFIRDPDDPEFHPVRDVLERNVVTQLRKIAFSAFVYGALVIVCLGGVVWGLSFSTSNILPIHYSSNEPVLEFPIDLLFYNFAMPLAVKFFKPSDGLHSMYTWWLRKCARFLRLSWFLFAERRIDEEGQLALRADSPHMQLPWWKRLFLQVNGQNQVAPKTWRNFFQLKNKRILRTVPTDKMVRMNMKKQKLVRSGQLIPDGSFVRAPAADAVKIPKGRQVFLRVSEQNTRRDGMPDIPETDVYSTDDYQLVYLPPHFRVRVFLFILFIWIFAAVTGVSFTILPLIFGRKMFQVLLPAHVRTNDIYAFSMGVYILGSAAYLAFHARPMVTKVRDWAATALNRLRESDASRQFASMAMQGLKLGYTYTMLLVVFPIVLTSLMELYLVIPLHTYINPPSPYVGRAISSDSPLAGGAVLREQDQQHTARVVQSWTLGLLYVKLGARFITSFYGGTRLANAVRAVLRRGWLRPDAGILTRAFVLPGLLVSVVALFGPAFATGLLERYDLLGVPTPAPHELTTIYRLSYPAAALSALGASMLWGVLGVLDSWKVRIRDEAYLVGERLHNFGVATAGASAGTGAGAGAGGGAAARGQWRVRGA